METKKTLEIGAAVVYITPNRVRVNGLVEVIHGAMPTVEEHRANYGNWPCINILFLSPDPEKKDVHGRQKERATSVVHGSTQGIPRGHCWLWPEEAEALSPEEAELKTF